MSTSNIQKQKKRQDLRFEREAKDLQKNLEKRKQQQKQREALKKADNNTATNQD